MHLDPSCQPNAAMYFSTSATPSSPCISASATTMCMVSSHRQHPFLRGLLLFLRSAEDVQKLVDAVSDHVENCRAVIFLQNFSMGLHLSQMIQVLGCMSLCPACPVVCCTLHTGPRLDEQHPPTSRHCPKSVDRIFPLRSSSSVSFDNCALLSHDALCQPVTRS